MRTPVPSLDLVDKVLAGETPALARLLSRVEQGTSECQPALNELYRHTGSAHIVGVTGVPGSGKSTLITKLVLAIRQSGRKAAILAVDPSSPFSGGAILGDRIRMTELGADPGIFIRSMATRGAMGGLAPATLDAVDVLDAAGFDLILIETVGAGQDEIDVVRGAHTIIVVSAPGLGDDIQAIKAGILEIADIHAVSKCDRSDADRTVRELQGMLALGASLGASGIWQTPVLATSGEKGEGITELLHAVDRHRAALESSGELAERQKRIAEWRILKIAEAILRSEFEQHRERRVSRLVNQVMKEKIHPRTAAIELFKHIQPEKQDMTYNHPSASDQELERQIAEWEQNELAAFLKRQEERKTEFRSYGGLPLARVYTALDTEDTPLEDIGLPGQYPFTRGAYPTMYRSRFWTMRQIAGFGTGEDTNKRFKYLIAQGQTGISTDFDMPTLMGYDSDHPMSQGEVGREGVAVNTLADMEALFDGIDLENISVSMTINPTAWILLAMYVVLAQKRGYDLNKLSGTIQADILKEYMAQKEWIYPIAPAVRLVRDSITYCAHNMKRFNPINLSGYHISEAGSSPLHEIAFTLANAITYVQEVVKTGMDVDEFAPRLSFFFVSQSDFFEEIAKFRAARRVYAKIMKLRFGAKNPESMRLRFHCQTAAASLTKPQYKINVIRTAFQALTAVLGGAQSLHTNGMDEAFAIPTEEAMKIALRTQQIIADETNVASVIDPLGGSYYLESLTTEFEKKVFAVLDEIEERGGTIKLIEEGWFQRHISDFAYATALRKASGEHAVIGVNRYQEPDEQFDIQTHPYDPTTEQRQIERLQRVRRERDNQEVTRLLRQLQIVAVDDSQNIMPVTIELVRASASMGEIVESLRELWGSYRETPVF